MAEQETKKGVEASKLPQTLENPDTAKNRSNTERSAKLTSMLADWNRPLEEIDWKPENSDRKPSSPIAKLNRDRRHRRELRRARRAAQQTFHIKPRRSARKQATAMLSAGAMGLAAFTAPPFSNGSGTKKPEEIFIQDFTKVRGHPTQLKASDHFKKTLIEEEGVRHVVYRDVAGYPTVGVGHLIERSDNLRVGDRVSNSQVLKFLDADLVEAEEGVRQLVGDLELYQHEFDALLDLVYNVGIGNVSPSESPRLNAAIDAGDYQAIADELNYTHAAGRVARGLEHRSDRRAEIFMNANYEDPRDAAGRNTSA